MVTDVYLVYNGDNSLDNLRVSPFFHFINENTRSGKKEAYKLKSEWGAKLTPFAICFDKDIPIKAFYSEACNVLDSLIKYLNEYE